jgi:hypothetical protein
VHLTGSDVERICDALLDEFMSAGLSAGDEPNEWGVQLELAIDWIRRRAPGEGVVRGKIRIPGHGNSGPGPSS